MLKPSVKGFEDNLTIVCMMRPIEITKVKTKRCNPGWRYHEILKDNPKLRQEERGKESREKMTQIET